MNDSLVCDDVRILWQRDDTPWAYNVQQQFIRKFAKENVKLSNTIKIFATVVSRCSFEVPSLLQIDTASRACGWFLMYLRIDYLFNFIRLNSALNSIHVRFLIFFCFSRHQNCIYSPTFVNSISRFRRYWPTVNTRCVR